LPLKSRQQRTNIGATTNRLHGSDCGFDAFARLQPLPHALGGR
jgi:hypothetical protein